MRIRAITATLALAASMAIGLFPSTAAHAVCDGTTEVVRELEIAGTLYATEWAYPGTCQGNNVYQGYVQSNQPDWRVSAWVKNGSTWSGFYGSYNITPFLYAHSDTNSHTGFHFCVDDGNGTFICGIDGTATISGGVTHTYYDFNDGF